MQSVCGLALLEVSRSRKEFQNVFGSAGWNRIKLLKDRKGGRCAGITTNMLRRRQRHEAI